MTQRLTKRQMNKLYKEYSLYFNGLSEEEKEKAIAYEFAKDFIYNASREYQRFLNKTFASHDKILKFQFIQTINGGFDLWKEAIKETNEYLKPTKTIKESFEERIAKEQFKTN